MRNALTSNSSDDISAIIAIVDRKTADTKTSDPCSADCSCCPVRAILDSNRGDLNDFAKREVDVRYKNGAQGIHSERDRLTLSTEAKLKNFLRLRLQITVCPHINGNAAVINNLNNQTSHALHDEMILAEATSQ